ncbi:MAG: TetR/AcrR family transcriptional regulator [Candidatus Pelethousia sp.]|nr:TetR/AcrR family transcriptional regulator [Candidatus Pelethousia sp.]
MPRKHGEYASVREAILATAAQLFTRQGIHGTSLGDIAGAADLSKGTLYYYYPAKEELVLTIAEGCLSHFTEAILAWVDGLRREEPLRPALTRLIHALRADCNNARLYLVLLTECATGDEALRAAVQRCTREWVVLLEMGTLKLQSRTQLLGKQAEMFFTLFSGCLLQDLAGNYEICDEYLLDAVLPER